MIRVAMVARIAMASACLIPTTGNVIIFNDYALNNT